MENRSPRGKRRFGKLVWCTALCAFFGCVLGAGAPAQEAGAARPAPSADNFAQDFDAAMQSMTQRHWREAHTAWLELLRRHAGAEYVRPRLAEVRELLRKSAFWSVTQEPSAKQAVGGGLRSYSEGSGHVELAYSAENLSDFERAQSPDQAVRTPTLQAQPTIYVHPLIFKGPYRITFVGTSEELMKASVVFAFHAGNGYMIRIGSPSGVVSSLHTLVRIQGTHSQLIDQRALDDKGKRAKSAADRKIHAVVRVDESTISYTYDGATLFQIKNEDKAFGQWGLGVYGDFGAVEVDGAIDPSWIDGRKDALVQSAREVFESEYTDPPELAAWPDVPSEKSTERGPPTLFDSIPLPPLTRAQSARVDQVNALRSGKHLQQAVEFLSALGADDLPPGVAELLLAYCQLELARPASALEHLLAAERTGKGLPDLRLMRADLLRRLERAAEAGEILAELTREHPDDRASSAEFVRVLMDQRRFAEARAELERVLQSGAAGKELADLRSQLVKAVLGPEWREAFSFVAQHFVVHSDLDARICKLAADELEDTWTKCCAWYGAPAASAPETPTQVYLFAGEASYRDYILGISHESPENTLGAYSSAVDQILAWNSSNREGLLNTLRHECVHRYLDRVLGAGPPWLEEGLAEFVAASKTGARKWVEGAVPPEFALRLQLASSKLEPLARLLPMDEEHFMQDGELHYTEAWAFVHWLRATENARGQELFTRLWRALSEPTDVSTALGATLLGVDMTALDREFLAHVNALLHAPPPAKGKH